jgi:hypothetical protein
MPELLPGYIAQCSNLSSRKKLFLEIMNKAEFSTAIIYLCSCDLQPACRPPAS